MNRFVLGLMASAVVATSCVTWALPAAAQSYSSPSYPDSFQLQGGYGAPAGGYGTPSYDDEDGGVSSNGRYGRPGYGSGQGGDFSAQLERLTRRVNHGVDEGSLSPRQAQRFFAQVGGLRRLERQYRYSGGFLDGRERMDLQARLEQLKDQVRGPRGPSGYGQSGYDQGGYGQDGYGSDGYNAPGYDNEGGWSQDRGDRGPRR